MSKDTFDLVEKIFRGGGSEASFDFLVQRFREEKSFSLLFQARLMKKRYELGLPLIQMGSLEDVPNDKRPSYEEAFIEAAREVGYLYLAEGDIPRAWSYFRAIGETAPVAAAIEQTEPKAGIDAILEIAFHERVNPRRGFELILANYGICRAITSFGQYPVREGRDDCLRLLLRTLYTQLIENLKRTIAQVEGKAPVTDSVTALVTGRDWLFEGNNYYVDTSHLVSVIGFSLELNDAETLALAVELTEYGKRLAPLFHYRGDPPFQNVYEDHAVYLRALLGEDVESAIAHFRNKVIEEDANEMGHVSAQALVELLSRLERYPEAIEVSLEYLHDLDPTQLTCPSVFQLCQLAGDYQQLMQIARQQGDLLSFTAAALQTQQ